VHFHAVPPTQRILDAFLVQCPGEPPHSGARIVDWLCRSSCRLVRKKRIFPVGSRGGLRASN
jgi:hypothetical protein